MNAERHRCATCNMPDSSGGLWHRGGGVLVCGWCMSRRLDEIDVVDPQGAFATVRAELDAALAAYPAFHTPHEGYAVLLEEVDELWEEVKKRPASRDTDAMRREAIQVAAMAIRFVLECAPNGAEGKK